MKDNRYLGGDTDSLILEKPLDPLYVGNKLGQLELEYIIKQGLFLSKKFYALLTSDNKEIIKSKGIKNENKKLTYEEFKELFKGNDLEIKETRFFRSFKSLDIVVKEHSMKIKGINNKEITSLFQDEKN
jgi:hypothetical protein